MAARDRARRLKGGPTVALADGTAVQIPPDNVDLFRGLDAEGCLVYAADWDPDYLMGLTACCLASAKGSVDATVCRNCYREIPDYLGGPDSVAPGKERE